MRLRAPEKNSTAGIAPRLRAPQLPGKASRSDPPMLELLRASPFRQIAWVGNGIRKPQVFHAGLRAICKPCFPAPWTDRQETNTKSCGPRLSWAELAGTAVMHIPSTRGTKVA